MHALKVVARCDPRGGLLFGGGGEHGGVRPSGGEDGAGPRPEVAEDGGSYMRHQVQGGVREEDVRAVVGAVETALGCVSVRYRTLEQELSGELVAAPSGPRTGLAGAPPDASKATKRQYASVSVFWPLPAPRRTELPLPPASPGDTTPQLAHAVGPDGALEGQAWTEEDDEWYEEELLFGYKPPALLRCVGTAVPGLKLESGERLPAVILPVVDQPIPGTLDDLAGFLRDKGLELSGSALDRSGFKVEPWRPSMHRMTVLLHRPTSTSSSAPAPGGTWRLVAFVRAQRDTYLAAVKCLDRLRDALAASGLVAFEDDPKRR